MIWVTDTSRHARSKAVNQATTSPLGMGLKYQDQDSSISRGRMLQGTVTNTAGLTQVIVSLQLMTNNEWLMGERNAIPQGLVLTKFVASCRTMAYSM